jgi:phage gpG-like protein
MSYENLKARLDLMRKNLDPNSPEFKQKMHRIGMLIESQTKFNIKAWGMIDSGRLLNSVGYRIEGNELIVGSFGVPYAAINEFGGPVSKRQLAAMFASFRRSGKKSRESKGIIRNGMWKARPYLRPAITKLAPRIVDILRENL